MMATEMCCYGNAAFKLTLSMEPTGYYYHLPLTTVSLHLVQEIAERQSAARVSE